jgi:predicted Zn-dependent protease
LSETGNAAAAEAELRELAAAQPASERAQRAAAAFYLAAKRNDEAERYLRAAAAVPDEKLKSTLALADFLIAAKRLNEAQAVLDPVTGPLEAAAKVRLAAIALQNGSPVDARRLLDAALKKHPTAEGLALNAQLLQMEGRADAALAAARSALEMNATLATAQYVAGTIELDRGNVAQAEQAFRAVLQQDPQMKSANLQLARAKLAAGQAADAIPYAEAAGNDQAARLTLARALIGAGQTARARAELQQLAAANPSATEPAVLLGSIELAAGELRDARLHADRALAVSPANVDALLLAARTALAAHDAADAERLLSRAAAADPRSFDAHLMLAQVRASRGDLAGARATIETIAARRPDVAQARTALGIVLEASNHPGDARTRYEQALALDPGEPIAANNLARIYAADDAKTTEAIELARKAVARLPGDAAAHDTLGWIAYKAGRLTLARSALERAVALDPLDAAARMHLQKVRSAIDAEARVKAVEAAERAKLLPDESKDAPPKP